MGEGLASLAVLGIIYSLGGVVHYWNRRESAAIKLTIAFLLISSILLGGALGYVLTRWRPLL